MTASREAIADLFRAYDGVDVVAAAEAFGSSTHLGLTGNQRNQYRAMESLLAGRASHWPDRCPSAEGSKTVRVSVRLMIHAARNSDQASVVLNAGRVLAQAAARREPCIPLRFKKWSWQYLGDAPVPGVKWGYTEQSHPINRIFQQQPWIKTVHALLPVYGREMDAKIKSELDYARAPGGYPELYAVDVEYLVQLYMEHRK